MKPSGCRDPAPSSIRASREHRASGVRLKPLTRRLAHRYDLTVGISPHVTSPQLPDHSLCLPGRDATINVITTGLSRERQRGTHVSRVRTDCRLVLRCGATPSHDADVLGDLRTCCQRRGRHSFTRPTSLHLRVDSGDHRTRTTTRRANRLYTPHSSATGMSRHQAGLSAPSRPAWRNDLRSSHSARPFPTRSLRTRRNLDSLLLMKRPPSRSTARVDGERLCSRDVALPRKGMLKEEPPQ